MNLRRHSCRILCLLSFLLTSIFLSARARETQESPAPTPTPRQATTLTVTVTDRNHNPVTGLNAGDFKVYDNNQLQQITSFDHSDVPVCIGLLVDSSGSMRAKQKAVSAGMLDLVKAGNPEDQIFLVNFSDEPYIDQDFTKDPGLIAKGLERAKPRGGTALYDTVIASADHLAEASQCDRRVLVVVSDGVDNASRKSLQQTLDALQDSTSPIVIYAVALLEDVEDREMPKARHALDALTAETGGVQLLIRNMKYLHEAVLVAAEEIRTAYRITYAPTGGLSDGAYHKVRLEIHAQGKKDLTVHVRNGYTVHR